MLRTRCLAELLYARLLALGEMSEAEAIDALDARAPGRGPDVLEWAQAAGMIRRVEHEDGATLQAAGAPHRHLAA
jgi:hypothetical protein